MSDGRGVDPVVLGVGPDKADEEKPTPVVNSHDETIAVAVNVEDDAVIREDARRRVLALDVVRRRPIGPSHFSKPSSERMFGVLIAAPECLERAAREDPHRESVALFPFWEQAVQDR